jgi:hypothetical protein
MKKGTLPKKAVFPLLFTVLLTVCDNGIVLNSSDPPPEAILYPPSGIRAETLSPSRVKLSWTPVPGAVQYNIYRETSLGALGPPLASVAPPVCVYEDTGLSSGIYYYEVAAEGAGGEEHFSGYIPVVPLLQLAAPAPRGGVQSPVSIRLEWDAVPDATGYKIYRASVPSGDPPPSPGPLLATRPVIPGLAKYIYYDVAPTGTYYDDTKSYYYWVEAVGSPNSVISPLPKNSSGVIQGIRNTQSANPLTVSTTPVSGSLPRTQGSTPPPLGTILYYFFSTAGGAGYRIDFSGLNSSSGARFSVFLETTSGQSQLLNIIDVGGPDPNGKSYTFTAPAAGGVVVISSDGRTNYGSFSITQI